MLLKQLMTYNWELPDWGNFTYSIDEIHNVLFEFGNGRIGRAIADKALSQSFGYPLILSLSTSLEKSKSNYYEPLEQAQKKNEITSWISYFLKTIVGAQHNVKSLVIFTLKKSEIF